MRGVLVFLVCVTGLAIAQQSKTAKQPLVTAPIGKIRGSILTSRLGREIYSFRGIRYGEPPVGSQRFQVKNPLTGCYFTSVLLMRYPCIKSVETVSKSIVCKM